MAKRKSRPVYTGLAGTGGTVRVDPHPNDAPPGVTYEDPLPPLEGGDLRGASIEARARYQTSSKMVMARVKCQSCGRTGRFYGHEDDAPDPETFRCDRCEAP